MRRKIVVSLADPSRGVRRVLASRPSLIGSEGFEVLVENGWYAFADMSARDVRSIADQFQDDPIAADERMAQWVRDRVDQVESDLALEFPDRRAILANAFAAHREGTFNLSVPVFLAQADGIWLERCGHNLFDGDISATVAAALGDRVRNGVIDRLLRTLTSREWKLRRSKGGRGSSFSDLNRHQVLHGEATDYGTEENSLKAIAMLHFSNFVLSRLTS